MRLMSINVWSDYMDNPVEAREDGIYNVIMKYSPDIFGLQEMSKNWHLSKFTQRITEHYTYLEIQEENHMPIYFKKGKFELWECGWERHDDTPHKDKSIAWAVLIDNETNKKIGVCNTHFWFKNGEEHDRIRDKNAGKLLKRMTDIKNKYGCPVFSFGDFNCTIESTALKLLEENNIYTSFKLTENHSPIATYHGYPTRGEDGKFYGKPTTTEYTKSIDHFITFKGDVVITKQEVVVYPEILGATDHSPIYVDIEF